MQGLEQFSKRSGQPTLRLIEPTASCLDNEPPVTAVTVGGFNVYAGRVIDGRDRPQLERQCRYLGRPPLAQDRICGITIGN